MRALIGLTLLVTQTAFAEALLRVRPHVVVSPNSEVRLMQLVDSQGLSADSESILRSTSMTKAPAYGERQELAQASLMEVLRPLVQKERARSKKPVRLLLPKSVTIDTLKRDLSVDLVWAELKQVWQPLCSDCKLEIEGLSLPSIQGVRDWTLKLKAELPRGGFSVPISIIREDTAPVSAWISGRLIVKRKVPAAKRAISINERLQEKDFGWEYRDVSYATDGIPEVQDIVGRQVRQGLRAGEPIFAGMLAQEKAVHRGEPVVVKSSEAGWEVSMVLVAQQDAVVGDTINLRNPKTNSNLVGHVTGLGEVELR